MMDVYHLHNTPLLRKKNRGRIRKWSFFRLLSAGKMGTRNTNSCFSRVEKSREVWSD